VSLSFTLCLTPSNRVGGHSGNALRSMKEFV
jgi:hypothetical protein